MELPTNLESISKLYWAGDRSRRTAPGRPDEITVVTAFFDIDRANWNEGNIAISRFRRTVDSYFEAFARLAKLKNEMVIFIEPRLAERTLELRRANGLASVTSVVVIDDMFASALLAPVNASIRQRMTPRFHRWVVQSASPEYREPRYVLVNALKAAYVETAIRLGLVVAPQAAWIDFGYCGDDQRFDPAKPWRFEAAGKMNLFYVIELDDLPVYRIVKYGTNYFMGCHIVGPAEAWSEFAAEISLSMTSLLGADLIDDDQTLMLMAWRRNPAKYRIHAVTPPDWRVIFRRFNADVPLQDAAAQRAPHAREESALKEEMRIAMKRWEWWVKKKAAALGFR